MIRTPTAHELEAIALLEHNPNFKQIVTLLQDSLDETRTRCIEERDEITLRQAQGAAVDLNEFLTLVGDARAMVEKLRKRTP